MSEKENNNEFSSSENWKLKHETAKQKIEVEKDKWKNAYYEADKKILDLQDENYKLKSQLKDWERKELASKTFKNKDEENIVDKEKQERLKRFLKKIK